MKGDCIVLLLYCAKANTSCATSDIANFDCWLATLPLPNLDSRGLRTRGSETPYEFLQVTQSFKDVRIDLNCIECSSPRAPDVIKLLSTPNGIEDATRVIDDLLGLVVDVLGSNYMQITFDRWLAESRFKCPHRPEYNPTVQTRDYAPYEPNTQEDSVTFLIAVAVAAICLLIVVAAALTTVRTIVRRRHHKWLDSLSDRRVLQLWRLQLHSKEQRIEVDKQMSSLFKSDGIPVWIRWGVPLIIVGNIALFLSGHLSPAASVSVLLSLGGEGFRQDDFFEFSIARGTVNLWKAGGKELAILILLFSGVWPYTKQLISLVLWFLPPNMLSSSQRGNIYRWLDALAKWSMIDVFTILISLVAFRVSIRRYVELCVVICWYCVGIPFFSSIF